MCRPPPSARFALKQKNLDFIPKNKLEPKKGRLLISEPFLDDPYFNRTVILLCEHNDEGSFGFVLNKYVQLKINELLDDFPQFQGKIGLGGPVNNTNLYYIHTLGEAVEGSNLIVDNIYMGGNFETIRALLDSGQLNEQDVRFFVGYSGWTKDQLNEEIRQNAWYVAEASNLSLMKLQSASMWNEILKKMGKEFALLANFPIDPGLN